jgi:hypothetical protein
MIQTTTPAQFRVPVILPDETRLKAYADQQRARGLRLVTDGKSIYLTPLVMPGERDVPAKVAA